MKKSVFVGLAVHHARLSMIKLKQIKKDILIEGFATADFPAGYVTDGEPAQAASLSQMIKQLVRMSAAENCYAALALPASQVINKRIRVAACLNDKEREAEIGSNLKYYLPGINEPLNFDFVPIENQGNEVELQLIAARTKQVETYISAAKAAELKIKIVDVDVYAAARAICVALPPNKDDQIIVLLEIDILTAQLILLKNGKVISIYPIVMDAEDTLLQQIKRGMQIFSAAIQTANIEKILLIGHLPKLPPLKTILKETFAIPVHVFDTFHGVLLHPKLNVEKLNLHTSELLVAFGLALRGLAG